MTADPQNEPFRDLADALDKEAEGIRQWKSSSLDPRVALRAGLAAVERSVLRRIARALRAIGSQR